MKELKKYTMDNTSLDEMCNTVFYRKSEADRYIAYLKMKRCLALAYKYLWKRNYWRYSTPAYERQHQWEFMAHKHYKKMLKLAELYREMAK